MGKYPGPMRQSATEEMLRIIRENDDLKKELAAVRSALGAHDDSDLASLAETLVAQRRRLAAVIRVVSFGEGVDFDEYGLGDDLRLAESILEEGDAP